MIELNNFSFKVKNTFFYVPKSKIDPEWGPVSPLPLYSLKFSLLDPNFSLSRRVIDTEPRSMK